MALKSSSSMEGKKAPAFSLKDKDGKEHALKEFAGRVVVLFFYPRDNTPGCTIEATEFSSNLKKLRKIGVEIIGVSGGDDKTKRKFCEKNDLSVLLLSDTDFEVANRYGVYGEKSFMGRKFLGIHRTTFVIKKDGVIEKVFEKVTPKGHADQIIEFIAERRLKGGSKN